MVAESRLVGLEHVAADAGGAVGRDEAARAAAGPQVAGFVEARVGRIAVGIAGRNDFAEDRPDPLELRRLDFADDDGFSHDNARLFFRLDDFAQAIRRTRVTD